MYEQSPYEETIYLDADTEVLERLDFAIEKAVQFHLACVICEAPYARRYLKSITGDTIEYNTGVLFFRKSEVTAPLFALGHSRQEHRLRDSLRHGQPH